MNNFIRRTHRWLSIIFTAFVVANFAVWGRGELAQWVGLLTLLPLALLMLSGLYMFILPYASQWRRTREGQIA
jgi:hypothetical protein